jgi:hypothetical protein
MLRVFLGKPHGVAYGLPFFYFFVDIVCFTENKYLLCFQIDAIQSPNLLLLKFTIPVFLKTFVQKV